MAPSQTYLSAIAALIIVHCGNAQTGEGCYSKTCPEAGQVRINAIHDATGNFIGGCNCGCDPDLGSRASPNYCSTALNFNPITGRGDCSCIGGGGTAIIEPSAMPPPPTDPGTPMEVICGEQPLCECPNGHIGDCTLSCTGSPDACIDGIISCNNDGYRCNVMCSEQTACTGSTIIGPKYGALEVFCTGEEACETTIFEHTTGTDLFAMCDGATSCADAVFNFGSAVSYVECNGDPDVCQGAKFNLLPNARTRPGASFACVGVTCPLPPLAPLPFDNSGSERCSDVGDCFCDPNANMPCELNCNGTPDACKDAIIECNSDGFDCTINCRAMNACSGSTKIIGPRNAKLTVNCFGDKSCLGAVTVEASTSTDVTIMCNGFESCKGDVNFHFGFGVSSVSCNGNPDSCLGAVFYLVPGAKTLAGAAFECTGAFCPIDAPAAFSNVVSTTITAPQPPAVSAPPGASSSAEYCCLTAIADFMPWAGRCWDATTRLECELKANKRCVWDPLNCLPNPPVNSYPELGACKFYNMACTQSNECCSETCTIDGLCQ